MYLLIFYEIRAVTLTGYNNSYLFTIKSLEVNAMQDGHDPCSNGMSILLPCLYPL